MSTDPKIQYVTTSSTLQSYITNRPIRELLSKSRNELTYVTDISSSSSSPATSPRLLTHHPLVSTRLPS